MDTTGRVQTGRCQSTINVSVMVCVMPGPVAVMTGLYVADGVPPELLMEDDPEVPAVEVTPHPKDAKAMKSKTVMSGPLGRRIR